MKAPFETSQIESQIQQFELATGHELIVVGANASDPYPGAVWRGGLLLGLLVAGTFLHFFEFSPRSLEVLAVGALILLMATLLRLTGLHRFFVLPAEAQRETSEKALELFSRFQSKNLGHEAAVLLFFSMQEHKIHLLVDSDLNTKLNQADLDGIVELLQKEFHQRQFSDGISRSVGVLQETILEKVGKRPQSAENHVPNKVFWVG
jgi:uncharacterized membrane protein